MFCNFLFKKLKQTKKPKLNYKKKKKNWKQIETKVKQLTSKILILNSHPLNNCFQNTKKLDTLPTDKEEHQSFLYNVDFGKS